MTKKADSDIFLISMPNDKKTTFMESPYTKQIGLPEVSGSPICLLHCAQSYEYHCMS